MNGQLLQRELRDKRVLNACVLDALLEYPQFIPAAFRPFKIYFWGTLFQDGSGRTYVACIAWNGERWERGIRSLDSGFSAKELAACVQGLPDAA